MSSNIESKVENLIGKIINDIGYNIYDIQYVKEGKDYFLRVFIEKENGEIGLEDCEKVNNAINDKLDEADFIKDQYFLEVSSTGIEKTLRKKEHYERQIGNLIEVKLYKAIEGSKVIQGNLSKVEEKGITININEKGINIDFKDIASAKTVFEWEA